MLSIYIDFKSPQSWLAFAPTCALIKRAGIQVKWRAFTSVQGALPAQQEDESVGDSHRRVRAEQRRATLKKYAALQGIALEFPDIPGVTDLALGALGTLAGNPLSFIGAAFEAYWYDGQDLDDPGIVKALLAQTGYDVSGFDEAELRARHVEAQEAAEARGIIDAPAYVIADDLFIGREHLPWIEEIITEL